MKKRPQTESEARKNMMIYLKNTAGNKMDFFKGMTYAQICPIFQARFDENIRFLFKSIEEIEEEDQEIIKGINETPAQKAAKRRKLTTPLASKVPVVDYQIVLIDNKPRFKIIRADETHQFYISFAKLLKNFNREDLETLWRIVKDRFSTSKPTKFSDEYQCLRNQMDKMLYGEIKRVFMLLELMLSKRSKKNTKCVNDVSEELTAAKHKLKLFKNIAAAKDITK
nr:hypothetical protein [Tanacetum cinerariifolium]